MICKCGKTVHPERIKLGYNFCVDCSDVKKFTGHLVVFHKTGNMYDIIKDPTVAADLDRLSSRNGFGSKRRGLVKEGTNTTKKISPESSVITPKILKRSEPDRSKWKDEEITLKILDLLKDNPQTAKDLLDKHFNSGELSPIARKRILAIMNL